MTKQPSTDLGRLLLTEIEQLPIDDAYDAARVVMVDRRGNKPDGDEWAAVIAAIEDEAVEAWAIQNAD